MSDLQFTAHLMRQAPFTQKRGRSMAGRGYEGRQGNEEKDDMSKVSVV